MHVCDFSFEKDDRSLEVAFEAYGAVTSDKKKTFLFNQNIFNGTRPLDVALSGVLPTLGWWTGTRILCGIVVNPLFAIFVPFRATDRQTALTRTSAQSVGKPGSLLGIVPMTSQRKTLRIFCPWPHLRSLRRPVSLMIPLTLSFLRITSSIYCRVSRFCRTLSLSVVILLRRSANKGAPERVGKDKGSSAKRSNSSPSPIFNICFTNSQEFNSLVADSDELGRGNESTAVRNISNERLNVINDNTSANSTKKIK